MAILGDRKFVEIPGSRTHELPPLLVRTAPSLKRLDKVIGMANDLVEAPNCRSGPDQERRKVVGPTAWYLHELTITQNRHVLSP